MCQTAIKQSSFLTGFPPLGSCCKSTGLYTCSSFTSASLYRTVPGLSFTMKVGPKRSEWEIRILRKRMAYMKKREREKSTQWAVGVGRACRGWLLSLYVWMHTICVHNQHVSAYITWCMPKGGCCYYYSADKGEIQSLITGRLWSLDGRWWKHLQSSHWATFSSRSFKNCNTSSC